MVERDPVKIEVGGSNPPGGAMKNINKNITIFLINRFSKMSGDRKIQIAMRLSEMARQVRDAGITATNTKKEQWKIANKTFSLR